MIGITTHSLAPAPALSEVEGSRRQPARNGVTRPLYAAMLPEYFVFSVALCLCGEWFSPRNFLR